MQKSSYIKTETKSDLLENKLLFHSPGIVYLKAGKGNKKGFFFTFYASGAKSNEYFKRLF